MSRRLVVLMWHRVLPEPDPLRPDDPDALEFARVAALLARWFNVVSLEEGLAGLRAGTLPSRAVAITFDDGYADNLTVAQPILARLGLPATVFVATGYLNGGRMWNDSVIELVKAVKGARLDARAVGCDVLAVGNPAERGAAVAALIKALKYRPQAERQSAVDALAAEAGVALPGDLMLSSAGVVALARAGVDIGGHTCSHPILAGLGDDVAREEIVRNRAELAALTGSAPRFFAYPNGRPGRDYGARDVALVREAGYAAAVSTAVGAAASGDGLYELPRFGPWVEPHWKLAARLAKFAYLG